MAKKHWTHTRAGRRKLKERSEKARARKRAETTTAAPAPKPTPQWRLSIYGTNPDRGTTELLVEETFIHDRDAIPALVAEMFSGQVVDRYFLEKLP